MLNLSKSRNTLMQSINENISKKKNNLYFYKIKYKCTLLKIELIGHNI